MAVGHKLTITHFRLHIDRLVFDSDAKLIFWDVNHLIF